MATNSTYNRKKCFIQRNREIRVWGPTFPLLSAQRLGACLHSCRHYCFDTILEPYDVNRWWLIGRLLGSDSAITKALVVISYKSICSRLYVLTLCLQYELRSTRYVFAPVHKYYVNRLAFPIISGSIAEMASRSDDVLTEKALNRNTPAAGTSILTCRRSQYGFSFAPGLKLTAQRAF